MAEQMPLAKHARFSNFRSGCFSGSCEKVGHLLAHEWPCVPALSPMWKSVKGKANREGSLWSTVLGMCWPWTGSKVAAWGGVLRSSVGGRILGNITPHPEEGLLEREHPWVTSVHLAWVNASLRAWVSIRERQGETKKLLSSEKN